MEPWDRGGGGGGGGKGPNGKGPKSEQGPSQAKASLETRTDSPRTKAKAPSTEDKNARSAAIAAARERFFLSTPQPVRPLLPFSSSEPIDDCDNPTAETQTHAQPKKDASKDRDTTNLQKPYSSSRPSGPKASRENKDSPLSVIRQPVQRRLSNNGSVQNRPPDHPVTMEMDTFSPSPTPGATDTGGTGGQDNVDGQMYVAVVTNNGATNVLPGTVWRLGV